jgi:hypothetical protein
MEDISEINRPTQTTGLEISPAFFLLSILLMCKFPGQPWKFQWVEVPPTCGLKFRLIGLKLELPVTYS